jgi:HlyD family secretion protein
VVASGEPLLEMADPSALEVEVELLTVDAVRVSPGTPVELERWGGEHTLEGRVRVVEPGAFTKVSALGVEEQRVRVVADILSPPAHWSSLGDRYRVEARFLLWRGEDVLQVPASALFRQGENWAVFRLEGGRATVRPVEVGRRNGLRAQILSGLKEGDRVVIHPGDELEDGRRVRVRFEER